MASSADSAPAAIGLPADLSAGRVWRVGNDARRLQCGRVDDRQMPAAPCQDRMIRRGRIKLRQGGQSVLSEIRLVPAHRCRDPFARRSSARRICDHAGELRYRPRRAHWHEQAVAAGLDEVLMRVSERGQNREITHVGHHGAGGREVVQPVCVGRDRCDLRPEHTSRAECVAGHRVDRAGPQQVIKPQHAYDLPEVRHCQACAC